VCGLRPDDFYDLSPYEFGEILKPCIKRQTNLERAGWEQARFQAFLAMMPHVKKDSLKSPQALIKFDWEKKTESAKLDLDLSPTGVKEMMKIFNPANYGTRKR